jgi:hypothetical protein
MNFPSDQIPLEPGWIPGAAICIAEDMTLWRGVGHAERIDDAAADPAVARHLAAMAGDRDR